MNEVSSEAIPFVFYFFAIIFYIALIGKNSKKKLDKKTIQIFKNNDEKMRSFLSDSEKKLLALKDLHEQGLINIELYLKKTNQIANIVSKIIDNNIFEYARTKNDLIIDDLKKGIDKELKKKISIDQKNMDIDSLLVSVDNKIKSNLNKDNKVYEK